MIMINSTQVSYFTFGAYFNIGLFKYLFFLIIMCCYAVIICANLLLIVVICKNRSLHEPMYLFLCSLFVNELFGSTGLFPFLLVQIFADIHTVSAPFCFLQIFCVYAYATIQFHNLSIMSYDRYLAICYPLQYNTHMTSIKVAMLIAVTWIYPFVGVAVTISLSAPLQLCGNIINTVYCDNYSIVKLACSETRVNNLYGLIYTCLVVFGPLSLILYTYIKILKVCFSGSKQTRQKAVSTCTPHLASLLNFSFGSFFQILQSRFDMSSVPMMLRNLLSLYFLTCQPIFNPLMYGLQMSKIRSLCKVVFWLIQREAESSVADSSCSSSVQEQSFILLRRRSPGQQSHRKSSAEYCFVLMQ
ncbi:olfactory receptor 11A1-like [Perca fluviatilis]|uniref:olfactory receptor 11A1-like n=1 Tax=Perca fluviatilis TaxID=8168 RepID=UPI0019626650|nr:olfactory receptor 11A1-like [Perca fluviatilis]